MEQYFLEFLNNLPSTGATTFMPGIFSLIFGVAAIVVVPIGGFIGGLIQGIIVALVYNFLAPRIGGIKVQFKEDNQTTIPN